ncbi:unnamed protein product [Pelagomonas calceolata]|uniref:Succinate dehydrogenase assembly factor 4, mitochondrial n=1 Tax=Pelagomonas calceolata TaxID=35677 RepID=A0A7S3ZNR7_9STRA|nr:unnamed protein product [Pelagomonas calceolata]|mmetsp:Transcript_2129/g.5955  ORF Transcript_2129/g.5955 Transcript_2129/m.5955 type:complete len:120 (+) Transcript_2129:146-505(+)
MLRIPLRLLRTPAARRAVRPRLSAAPSLSAVSGACRPKSSAAAPADADAGATLAAPRDDPPPTKMNVAVDAEVDEDDDMEDMFVDTNMGKEWGGPTRGGRMPEPTRFGDWERKGRATDF